MGRASASTWVTLVVAEGCHSTPLCVSRACRPAHCGRSRTGEPKTQECLPCSRSGGLSGCPLTPSNSYNRRADLATTSAYGRRRRSRQSRRKFPRLDPSPPARPGAEPDLMPTLPVLGSELGLRVGDVSLVCVVGARAAGRGRSRGHFSGCAQGRLSVAGRVPPRRGQ